jgi:hypothetical protein
MQSEIQKECREFIRRFNAGAFMDEEVMFGLEKQTKAGLEPVVKLRQVVNETVISMQKVLKIRRKTRLDHQVLRNELCQVDFGRPPLSNETRSGGQDRNRPFKCNAKGKNTNC